jgi:large subunit ribosomal protein L22
METKVQLNGVRLAPRKVRAVINLLKKMDAVKAVDQLEHLIKRPSPVIAKLLRSAIANAENNFKMDRDNLFIKDVFVNEGIKLKRFMPRAQGRATEIQKKTSRVTIILDERVAGLRREDKKEEPKKEHKHQEDAPVKTKSEKAKPEIKTELGKKSSLLGGIGKKMFQRKSV